jgi:hypothetical protein
MSLKLRSALGWSLAGCAREPFSIPFRRNLALNPATVETYI